jgi:hypothetical protein
MDGVAQSIYPRKNWSSLVLYNCGHPANRALTPALVNSESGAFLHQFRWLEDSLIGAVPETWNWLEGWSAAPANGRPSAVHYTRGGPWFDAWQNVTHGDLWLNERDHWRAERAQADAPETRLGVLWQTPPADPAQTATP